MQNKGAIQAFAVILALACAYHLIFTWSVSIVEKRAAEATDSPTEMRHYLDSMNTQPTPIIGFLGVDYGYAKKYRINLGLDLKGGMNVTLEVSIPDLLITMSNNSTDSTFRQAISIAKERQKTSQERFVNLFLQAYEELAPNGRLASSFIFGHKNQSAINVQMTNEEVADVLRKEASQAIDRTFEVLRARVDNFGVTQPNLQKLEGSNRIIVELPGAQDPDRVQKLLAASAELAFWGTYRFQELEQELTAVNNYLAKLKAVELDTTGNKTLTPDTLQPSTITSDSVENKTNQQQAEDGESNQVNKRQKLEQLLAGGNETTGVDIDKDTTSKIGATEAGMTPEEFVKKNPLFGIMSPPVDPKTRQYINPNSAVLGYVEAKDTAELTDYFQLPEVKAIMPPDFRLAFGNKPAGSSGNVYIAYALKANLKNREQAYLLGGDVVTSASANANTKGGGFEVTMLMNNNGADRWGEITKEYSQAEPKKSIAIVLDGYVYSAPTVNDPILSGRSSITGSFTYEEANLLASVLKAGRLPTKAIIVEQAVVGPSLGRESIRIGLITLGISFLIILIYMAFYYGKAGINTDIALFANLFFLMGVLAALGATLTLPGITGLVLTLAMAVDANVLIFERVREEIREGKGIRLALNDGYKNANSAIIDSNVTTLLTSLILMVFTTGPVKGFAVVLFFGILTSLFSALFITRLIFEWQLNKKHKLTFATGTTMNWFKNMRFEFIKNRKIAYAISGILLIISIASIATKGFDLGVDLQGGRSYTVNLDNSDFSTVAVSEALGKAWGKDPTVKIYGKPNRIKILTQYKFNATGIDVDDQIEQEMYNALQGFYQSDITLEEFSDKSGFGIAESYKVGPTVARDVKAKSIWAIVLSLIVIGLYIILRFKGWYYGLTALMALAHDVIVVLGVFSLLSGVLPFSLEIDQAIIAAVLTVIGYSINDTVIVFDRIRENLNLHKKTPIQINMNNAINETISRTINTSMTVIFVLILSLFFGGEAIKGLSFAILIGVVLGTYSSIFVASPVALDIRNAVSKKNKA